MLAGFAIFVAGGAGAAYLGSRHGGAADATSRVEVHYAAAAVAPGTAWGTALAEGVVRTKQVASASRPVNAVTDPSQLAGRVAAGAIPPGAIVTTDMFSDPQTRIGTVVVAPGKRALSLELEPVAGLSGFAGAGDRIDVYGVAKGDETQAGVRLVLQGVEVLNVNGAGLPAAQGQPGGPNLVYLLAVTPVEAERLIYLSEYHDLYFDLVPKGEGPVPTPGVGSPGALAGLQA
jgi:pilus assembly protein CpaB